MTEQEFKDYIADEVLMGIRSEMGWEFTAIPDPIIKRYTMSLEQNFFGSEVYTSNTPIGVEIPDNSELFKLGGGSVIITEPIYEDTTQVNLTAADTAFLQLYYDVEEIPEYYRQSVRAYQAIYNETCFRLLTTDLTATEDDKVRAFGRREAWRHIMWATVADYDFLSQTGGFSRSDLHNNAIKQFSFEDAYIQRVYYRQQVRMPNLSSSVGVKGVWK